MDVWNCSTMGHGAQSVMIPGLILMQKWLAGKQNLGPLLFNFRFYFSAGCLAMMMQRVQLLLPVILDRPTILLHSGWTMYSAQVLRKLWTGAVFQGGVLTIAPIPQKMLELYVLTVS